MVDDNDFDQEVMEKAAINLFTLKSFGHFVKTA
jgi:hypothetical protein